MPKDNLELALKHILGSRHDDHDVVLRPAQSNGALTKAILTLGAFGVFEHLAEGGLSHVEIRIAFQMTSSDFLMSVRTLEIILFER